MGTKQYLNCTFFSARILNLHTTPHNKIHFQFTLQPTTHFNSYLQNQTPTTVPNEPLVSLPLLQPNAEHSDDRLGPQSVVIEYEYRIPGYEGEAS